MFHLLKQTSSIPMIEMNKYSKNVGWQPKGANQIKTDTFTKDLRLKPKF